MTEQGSGKVTGIWQIVRLKEFLQKWQSITLTSGSKSPPPESSSHGDEEKEGERRSTNNSPPTESTSHGGIFPAINKRLKNSYVSCDSDEESCQSPEPPPDVPKGYLAVYVGPELRRFVIPTSYLTHSLFKVLLEKAEEEFGYDHNGALTFPCEIETFKYLLKCIESNYNPHDCLDDRPENDPSLEE